MDAQRVEDLNRCGFPGRWDLGNGDEVEEAVTVLVLELDRDESADRMVDSRTSARLVQDHRLSKSMTSVL